MKALNIAENIIQWVVSLLTDRNQYVQLNGKFSFTRIINRSIVQGSGIGPTLFIISIMDFKQIGSTDYITKYADDARLLVPEKNDVGLETEFLNVTTWVSENKLMVNLVKTKELVSIGPMTEIIYLPLNYLVLKGLSVLSC